MNNNAAKITYISYINKENAKPVYKLRNVCSLDIDEGSEEISFVSDPKEDQLRRQSLIEEFNRIMAKMQQQNLLLNS